LAPFGDAVLKLAAHVNPAIRRDDKLSVVLASADLSVSFADTLEVRGLHVPAAPGVILSGVAPRAIVAPKSYVR